MSKHTESSSISTSEPVVEFIAEPVVNIKKKHTRRVLSTDSIDNDIDKIVERLSALIDAKKPVGIRSMQSIRSSIRKVKKDVLRYSKLSNTQVKKKKRNTRSGTSALERKIPVSESMIKFASWENDKLYSRVEVTREIYAYIKENKLQNPSDRRKILPDKVLLDLLELEEGSVEANNLTYFNIQRSMKIIFAVDK